MKNVLRGVASFMLVALALTLIMPFARTSSQAATTSLLPAPPTKKTDVVRGEEAKGHVGKIRSKNKALQHALKDMEKLGRTINWQNTAAITLTDAPAARTTPAWPTGGSNTMQMIKSSFAPQAQDYGTDGYGSEMTIITYSSDYDPYWVGTIYTYDASTNTYGTYSGVIDSTIIGDPNTADVVDELYYPQDGSDPIREGGGGGGCDSGRICPLLEVNVVKNEPAKLNLVAKNAPAKKGHERTAKFAHSKKAAAVPAGFLSWFTRYFRCLRRCTSMFALQCAPVLTMPPPAGGIGPYFLCTAIRSAIAGSIACAFNTRACGG